uniref:Uncharacterized protein n=1 Tax=Avena sativa TaxID=4498 RepID=A0ACD5XM41_AVESA
MKLVCRGVAPAWFLVPLLLLVVVFGFREASITQVSDFFFSIRPSGQVRLSKNNVQYPGRTKEDVVVSDETVHKASSSESEKLTIVKLQAEIAKLKSAECMPKTTDPVAEAPQFPASSDEIAGDTAKDVAAPRSKLSCNFTLARMKICAMEGDVRVHGKSATVYVVAASHDSYWPENGTVTIRPYARKLDPVGIKTVREVTIRSSALVVAADDTALPRCTVTHDVPAVVFSTPGGFSKNFFHAMDDTIIPLYNTAHEYDGHVQLLVTDYDRTLIFKLRHYLAALSIYPVIDLDADDAVRCFPLVHVGLERHDELRIDPTLSRKGYTMMDFRDFLRSAYSLKHTWATPANRSSGQRPRLLLLLRRRSRAITNEAEAIATAIEVGFEVVTAGPEKSRDMATFAKVVNSCDVMLGVHGAGLTNFVFLPNNGTVMQIIPWGEMKGIGWHEFGRPLPDMGLRYVDYEVTAEETTLKEVYPKDHAVFTDPNSIHKQGFTLVWEIFLNGQNLTLDIGHFREVMQQTYQSVTIT